MTDAPPRRDPSLPARLLSRVVVASPAELPQLLTAFLTAFLLFTSYMMLRPIRDAMGIDSGADKLPLLFWGTFIAMLAIQPVYGLLTSRFPRRVFLPWVYLFFAANLIAFWAWFTLTTDHTWIGRAYYIWVSVFNLFVVAVFWSLMADVFTRDQAGRLFGFIAAGISLGGAAGPLLSAQLARPIGTINLLPISAGILLLALASMMLLLHLHRKSQQTQPDSASPSVETRPDHPLGGSALAAFRDVIASPYLTLIAVFVFLLTWVSTFLYLEQAALVHSTFATRDERTAFFARIDFWVQIGSLTVQTLLFGRLFKWLGFRVMIVSIPIILTLAFAAIARAPEFNVVVAALILRRVGEYGITRPCRDILWTIVPREQKYKAKALIDTFVYRGGDAVSASLHGLLKSLFSIGPVGIAWLGAGTALAWSLVAWRLGRDHTARAASPAPQPAAP